MTEDEVMNYIFKVLHQSGVQMISAEHPNNVIMFTPEQESSWKMTLEPVKLD